MKHRFLLDENVLHHAVKGVDEHDRPDLSAAQLICYIAENCHSITVHNLLASRYWTHLTIIKREKVKAVGIEPLFFLTQFMWNSSKLVWEHGDLPALPDGVVIPAEDVDLVRLALFSHPLFVTSDGELREAVNQSPSVNLRALRPADAIPLAQDY